MAIQFRRGTLSAWNSNKSNIVAGEPVITTDTGQLFVGTGTGTYKEFYNTDNLSVNPSKINGYQSAYLSSAGSSTLTLVSGSLYLIAVMRANTTASEYQGLYLAQVHNSSCIRTISGSSSITMSISGTTLSFTTTQNYMRVIAIPLIDI